MSEVVIGGSVRTQWAEGGGGRGWGCAADGVMTFLLLKIGIFGVVLIVDAVIRDHGLGHVG